MKVEIDIDRYLIEKMFSNYCSNQTYCSDCPSQVVINEIYDGCFDKYADLHFKNEFQKFINTFLDLCNQV